MNFEETEQAFYKLKANGHAVLLDVVHDCEGKLERFRLHHYLTCTRCVQERDAQRETTN